MILCVFDTGSGHVADQENQENQENGNFCKNQEKNQENQENGIGPGKFLF